MTKKQLFFAITIFMTATVTGQGDISLSKPIHQIGLGLGGLHYQIRDDIIAPLRWDGFGFVGDFSYSIIGDKGIHDIELRVPFVLPSNRYEHKGKAGEINLGYGYIHRIADSDSYGQIHLGGLINWSNNLQWYDSWDDSHLYWLNAYELGPVAQWSNTIGGNHQLSASINFSLLALVSRPPEHRYYDQEKLSEFFTKPHENMKLTSLHEYISIRLHGQYVYPVSNKISMGVSYLLNYMTFPEPEHISIFSNSFQVNLLFKLGNDKREKS